MIHLKNKGFTLIELMIVVAIIGVLAAIAIPKFGQMLEKSREGATKGNLGSVKSASTIYYGDQQGLWPTTLNVFSAYTFSRYIGTLPAVKVTGAFVANSPNPAGIKVVLTSSSSVPSAGSSGWLYDSTQGILYINSTVKDSRNLPYSFYGFE